MLKMLFVFTALCFLTATHGQFNVGDIYDGYPFNLNRIDIDDQNTTDDLDEVYSLNYPYVYLPSEDYALIPQVGYQPIVLGMPSHRLLISRNNSSNSGNETTGGNQTSIERLKVAFAQEALASLKDLINKTSSTGNHVGSSLDVGKFFGSNNTTDLKVTDVPRNNVTNSTEDSSQRLPSSVYAINLNRFGPYLFPFSGHAASGFHPFTGVHGPTRYPLIL